MTSTDDGGFVSLRRESGIAVVTMERGKVNALNDEVVGEFRRVFAALAADDETAVVILTSAGSFFSFGFDIPSFLPMPREDFVRFLNGFTDFYRKLFIFPKPVIAALNGHTIAGGCMIATACDCRLMVSGRAKISLNEITFGASVFAGSVEILKFVVGEKNAREIILSGKMYGAEEARELGLVDQVTAPDDLMTAALASAHEYAAKDSQAFAALKLLLCQDTLSRIKAREVESIEAFTDIWYSASTQEQLEKITIRD
ncbi:enoyl-CoA hydratase/isomerase family protein [Gemmatimonadota bacterium]